MITAEFSPMASELFEKGPPSIEAIELARIIDRGIRESEVIDVKKLCIKEGEKVWSVMIDLYPMNNGGNLIDACALAAMAAPRPPKTKPVYQLKIVCRGHCASDVLLEGLLFFFFALNLIKKNVDIFFLFFV